MANGDGGGGKTVLVVILVVFGMLVLCCGGVWFMRGEVAGLVNQEFLQRIDGSGVSASETRDVASFTRIRIVGSADAVVTVGQEQSVVVESDDNLLPIISTTVTDGELVISTEGSYSTVVGTTVRVTVPTLEGVAVVGSGDIQADGVDAEGFDVSITGSGDLQITGRADTVTAKVTGSGDADLSGLVARDVHVTITGSGDVSVHASQSLDAKLNGSGDVTYGGDPQDVTKSGGGSGDVEPR